VPDLREQLLARHQVDDLVLLVGSNPLPVAVAGALLVRPQGSIRLVYTRESEPAAANVQAWLQSRLTAQRILVEKAKQIDRADPATIYQHVFNLVVGALRDRRSVGLHYTGGTKAMSVHAYRAALDAQAAARGAPEVSYSYLDASSLTLRIDPSPRTPTAPGQSIPISDAVRMEIPDLLQLHGWTLQKPLLAAPSLPSLAATFVAAHAADPVQTLWRGWCKAVLRPNSRKKDGQGDWKSNTELRGIDLRWPAEPQLAPIVAALKAQLAGDPPLLRLGALAGTLAVREQDLCAWLDGLWLESHVFACLQAIRERVRLVDVGQSLKTSGGSRPEFEVDLVATRGYQLFAISCTTGDEIDKLKLFEINTRARQLGGDEARVALVCCDKNPDRLQRQLHDDFGDPDAPQIRVFGRPHLPQLADELADWIDRSADRG
jgi:hypothetical protein